MDNGIPKTVDQALEKLAKELPREDKIQLSGMAESDILNVDFSVVMTLKNKFNLWNNKELMISCRTMADDLFMDADCAFGFIIKMLWKRLQTIKKIKVVK